MTKRIEVGDKLIVTFSVIGVERDYIFVRGEGAKSPKDAYTNTLSFSIVEEAQHIPAPKPIKAGDTVRHINNYLWRARVMAIAEGWVMLRVTRGCDGKNVPDGSILNYELKELEHAQDS